MVIVCIPRHNLMLKLMSPSDASAFLDLSVAQGFICVFFNSSSLSQGGNFEFEAGR